MVCYQIGFDYTKEGVGAYPQSDGMTHNYPYRRPDSVWFIGRDYSIKPNLSAIMVKNGAKLTDLLSVGVINQMQGLVLSERFKNVIERYKYPESRFYPAEIVKNNRNASNLGKYFLFMITESIEEYVDFSQSKFYIRALGDEKVREIQISNSRELIPGGDLQPGELLAAEMIFFKDNFDWDIFRIKMISGFIVSERLKLAIEEAGVTGIRFELVTYLGGKQMQRLPVG